MSTPTVADLGERALIARITARVSSPAWVAIGPGDDAAVIEPARGSVDVLTTDALVDTVHFDRRFVPADAIGHRALAVNLSDLAAMGASPRAALLSLALPQTLPLADFDCLLDGFMALADEHRVALIGGNITSTPGPLTLDVTALGCVKRRQVLTRAGARPGDIVYVTGSLGAAAIGLEQLQHVGHVTADLAADVCVARYLRPKPRVRAGMLLARNRVASSCMDVSDGLADCVHQVATASGVGITLDATALPIPPEVRDWQRQKGNDALAPSLSGGDDYELFFTVRPAHQGRLRGVCQQLGDLPITRIGVVTKSREVLLRENDAIRQLPGGYEHFM